MSEDVRFCPVFFTILQETDVKIGQNRTLKYCIILMYFHTVSCLFYACRVYIPVVHLLSWPFRGMHC